MFRNKHLSHFTKSIFASAAIVFSCQLALCQTTRSEIAQSPDKASGLYYPYPVTESLNTRAPKGFKPFYISHYGRHGSRYLVGEEQYTTPLSVFRQAEKEGKLTEFGKDVKERLETICKDAEGRAGELTPIGVRQHHDIAQRMYRAFPQVFSGKPTITAKSTTKMRCAHSMAAFCEGLKELNPKLEIPRESGQRYMKYLANVSREAGEYTRRDGEASQRSRNFEKKVTKPERLMSAMFTDPEYAGKSGLDPKSLMLNLFRIAIDVSNTECDIRLDDLFTEEERFSLWQNYNYHYYIHMSNPPSANGAVLSNAKPLLKNILEGCDKAISTKSNGADLRFGHDSSIVPLLGLMKVDGCHGASDDPEKLHEVYADYKISPMAANLQIILFKNNKDEVIVKLLLNEREVGLPIEAYDFPFYKWETFRTHIEKLTK